MCTYLNKESMKIETKAEWIEDVPIDGLYMMLPAGKHFYLLIHS